MRRSTLTSVGSERKRIGYSVKNQGAPIWTHFPRSQWGHILVCHSVVLWSGQDDPKLTGEILLLHTEPFQGIKF